MAVHRHYNGLKTAMLLGLLGAVVIGASWLLFGRSSTALVIGLAIALVMNGIAYWRSSTIALKAMHAYPVTEQQQPTMYAIVRELSQTPASRCRRSTSRPRPTRTRSPPAATRRTRPSAAPRGILAILDERELRGVLGHELMHVYNRDILTSSVAASASSVLTFLAYGAMYFGGDARRPNPIGAIAISILGPLAAGVGADGDLAHPGVRRRRGRLDPHR